MGFINLPLYIVENIFPIMSDLVKPIADSLINLVFAVLLPIVGHRNTLYIQYVDRCINIRIFPLIVL